MNTPDAIYDCSWSETNANVIALACANGDILLHDYANNTTKPFKKEHLKESSCVDWNLVDRDQILSTSWDGTIKIWNQNHQTSIDTFYHGRGMEDGSTCTNVYQASWMPSNSNLFISVGSDCSIHLWDKRVGMSMGIGTRTEAGMETNKKRRIAPSQSIHQAHTNEILSVDWNKYEHFQFLSASSDCTIKMWDWKFVTGINNSSSFPNHHNHATNSSLSSLSSRPLHTLNGHQRAVRRVKCNPWNKSQFISAGYDMTVRCWDISLINPSDRIIEDHTEFVIGLDYSLHERNVFASCSWDDTIRIYKQ